MKLKKLEKSFLKVEILTIISMINLTKEKKMNQEIKNVEVPMNENAYKKW